MVEDTSSASDREPDLNVVAPPAGRDTAIPGLPRPRTTESTGPAAPGGPPILGPPRMSDLPDVPLIRSVPEAWQVAAVPGDCLPLPAWQLRPGVEWGIVWADGRITVVATEAAARMVTDRDPSCRVACRLVGAWGAP